MKTSVPVTIVLNDPLLTAIEKAREHLGPIYLAVSRSAVVRGLLVHGLKRLAAQGSRKGNRAWFNEADLDG